MRVIDLRLGARRPIDEFDSAGAAAHHLGSGAGAVHVYAVHLEPGGVIGAHEAGFDQLFVPVHGGGWAAGADGVRRWIGVGEAAVIRRGEVHAKGSETGLVALMVQVERLEEPVASSLEHE